MKTIILLVFLLLGLNSFADSPKLTNLSQGDVDKVSNELRSNFLFSEVSPAQSLGDVWGVEVGVMGGVADSEELNRLVQLADPNTTVDKIPHAGLFLAGTIPFYGITLQSFILPEVTASGVSLESLGFAAKWTITDVFFSFLPLDIALRGHYVNSEFVYSQDVTESLTNSTVNTAVTIENDVYGIDLSASADILIFEPYIGFGYTKGKTDLNVGIESDLLSSGLGSSVTSKDSSGRFFVGLQLDLWLAHITAEFNKMYDTERYSGKISFYF